MPWWGILIISIISFLSGIAVRALFVPDTEFIEVESDCEHSWSMISGYHETSIFGTRTTVVQQCQKCGELREEYI